MVLLGGPDLLLLDEPLNGLDPEAARDMRNYLVQHECGESLRVRTADPSRTLALLEDAALGDGVRFAAEPDGSIVVSGGFDPAHVSALLHRTGQEVLELSRQSRDMEEYFVTLMEGGR